MEERCYRKLSKDTYEKILRISTKCNNKILVLIGEDWSLSRLKYQVTPAKPEQLYS